MPEPLKPPREGASAFAAGNAHRNPAVSLAPYRDDLLHPKIVRAVEAILQQGKVVAPVDVLVRMGLLAPERLEDWRFGRVPCLERVIHGRMRTRVAWA